MDDSDETAVIGDDTALIVKEFFGNDTSQALPRRDQSRDDMRLRASRDVEPGISLPLHRMHEQRVVHRAGNMVVGFRMPTPDAIDAQIPLGIGHGTPVFSARTERGSGVSSAVLAFTCAFALAGAALLTEKLATSHKTASDTLGNDVALGTDVVSDTPSTHATLANATSAPATHEKPIHLMTASSLSMTASNLSGAANTVVASLSPAIMADNAAASASGLIRIAQKDSAGLGVSNVFGPAGAPIRLPISLNGARPEDYSFLMVRGLPQDVTLSAGFRLREAWAVSLRDIDNLMLETPVQFQGVFKLEILLIKGRDTPGESRVITVEVVPADIRVPPSADARQPEPGPQILTAAPRIIEPVERAVPVERAAPPSVRPAPSKNASASISPQQEETMMKRAVGLMESKDLISARLLLEHLANNGSARAALAMGKTFDPVYLRTIGTSGLKPDTAKARQWYNRAAELGDTEAPSRLSGLR